MKRIKLEWLMVPISILGLAAFIFMLIHSAERRTEAVTIGSRATEVHRTNLYVSDAAVSSSNPIPTDATMQLAGTDVSSSNPVPITETSGGTSEYCIKRTNIDPNTSVNLAFGFTAQNVFVYASNSNTQELIVDWLGGTAVAPSANTAGDFTMPIGGHMTKSNFSTTSISIISGGAAGTGSQTVYVNASR